MSRSGGGVRKITASALKVGKCYLTDGNIVRRVVTILPDRLVALLPIGSLERVDVPAPGGRPRGGLVYRAEVMPQPAIAAIADHFRSVAQAIDGTDQAAFNARPA